MSKRPSFQFYPADWRGNAKLRRCTEAARGVWMDVLCVLHDEDEYGIARYDLPELARAAGIKLKYLKELVEMGVLKGAKKNEICEALIYTPRSGRKDGEPVTLIDKQHGPIWYSSRFVRDEHVRLARAEHGKNNEPKATPKPPIGEGKGVPPSSSSSSPSVEERKITSTASNSVPREGGAEAGYVEAFDQAGRAAYGEHAWDTHRPWPKSSDQTTNAQLLKLEGATPEAFRGYCEFSMRTMSAAEKSPPSSPAYFVRGFAEHLTGSSAPISGVYVENAESKASMAEFNKKRDELSAKGAAR